MEVDNTAEVECATTLRRNLVVWTARLMDPAILKLKTAIHRNVQVSLINLYKSILSRELFESDITHVHVFN